MASEQRFSYRAGIDKLTDDRSVGDVKPRLGRLARTQLGSRLRAIYCCDSTPMPDAIRNLLARIDAHLQSHE